MEDTQKYWGHTHGWSVGAFNLLVCFFLLIFRLVVCRSVSDGLSPQNKIAFTFGEQQFVSFISWCSAALLPVLWVFVQVYPDNLAVSGRILSGNTHTHTHTPRAHARARTHAPTKNKTTTTKATTHRKCTTCKQDTGKKKNE